MISGIKCNVQAYYVSPTPSMLLRVSCVYRVRSLLLLRSPRYTIITNARNTAHSKHNLSVYPSHVGLDISHFGFYFLLMARASWVDECEMCFVELYCIIHRMELEFLDYLFL